MEDSYRFRNDDLRGWCIGKHRDTVLSCGKDEHCHTFAIAVSLFFRPFAIILPKARFSHFEDVSGVTIPQNKVRNKKKPRNPAVTGLFFGPSDWNRTSGLLNPILSPRLFVAENKEIIQLFRAFAIFRIVFISYFPYIPLAFRLYSTSVVGEERATMRPSLERILLHPLSNRRAKSLLLVALLNRALMRFRLFIVVDSN